MKKLSIIIVTYNSGSYIETCLDSIFQFNDLDNELEVIVVDNQSVDQYEMFQFIESKYGTKIQLIKNEVNGGYGQGNNIGIINAKAPYIMIMNPDVILYEPIFKREIRRFNENSNLALLGLRQYEADGKEGVSFLMSNISAINCIFHQFALKLQIFNSKISCIAGACFMIRSSAIKEAGMFDEDIFLYGEERDLNHRIRQLKYCNHIAFDKKAGFIHPSRNRSLSIESFFLGFKSFLKFKKKNGISFSTAFRQYKSYVLLMIFISFIKGAKQQHTFFKLLLNELNNKRGSLQY